jgi:acyl-CoA thioesterase I
MSCYRVLGMVVLLAGLLALPACDDDDGLGTDVGTNRINTVVALGDSITEGHGVTPYPSILATLINKTVVNAGVGGHKAADGAARIRGLLEKHEPGYLIVMLGSNDAIHAENIDGMIDSLRSIVLQARARGTIPVLSTVPPMTLGHSTFNDGVVVRNQRIIQLAGEQGVAVVDINGVFGTGEGLLTSNGLHPNSQGQTLIAQAFAGLF